jgi:hypothetical protein
VAPIRRSWNGSCTAVGDRLAANAANVDNFTTTTLNSKVDKLDALIQEISGVRLDVATAIRDNRSLQLAILDYDNQFNIGGVDVGGRVVTDPSAPSFITFLKGQFSAQPGGSVRLDPDTGLTFFDLSNYVGRTQQAATNPGDILRRGNDLSKAFVKLGISFNPPQTEYAELPNGTKWYSTINDSGQVTSEVRDVSGKVLIQATVGEDLIRDEVAGEFTLSKIQGIVTNSNRLSPLGVLIEKISSQGDDDGNRLTTVTRPDGSAIITTTDINGTVLNSVAFPAPGVPVSQTVLDQAQALAKLLYPDPMLAGGGDTALADAFARLDQQQIFASQIAKEFGDSSTPLTGQISEDGSLSIQADNKTLRAYTEDGAFRLAVSIQNLNGSVDTAITNTTNQFISQTHTDYFYDDSGTSRIETVTTAAGTVKNVYNDDNTLFSSTPVESSGPSNAELSSAANVAVDLINFSKTLSSGAPGAYSFASGIVLLNHQLNPNAANPAFPNFGTVATVAQGALSLYNLGQAFNGNGSDLAKFSAVGNGLNFINNNFIGNPSLTGALNGTGTTFSTSADGLIAGNSNFGLANGGTVGILPAIGLISAIKSGDPIGIVQSSVALYDATLLFETGAGFTPLGWFFIGASLLQALFSSGPPKAWGVADVTYGDGITNYGLKVNAVGDSFGTDRARNGLQNIVNYLQSNVVDAYNSAHDASHQVGLIAQRMPGLAWRASDAGDPGFKLTDIDPLTGEQKYPYRRFDDNGVPFTSNAAAYQVDPTDPNQRGTMGQALVMSAYNRQAIAPLWEVRTAKMQGDAGAVNAGLSEEERAAKAGLSAALDTAYANSHTQDATAKNKRLGSFMAVAMDFNGDNRITTTTIAQDAALNGGNGISFNWDDQSYQKKVGWVGDGSASTDGFLVLDRDFNQSVDDGTELLSNPLVADPAKGLRSLATWDADGDGRITAADPIFYQLKVWQDFNQDGRNTHSLNVIDPLTGLPLRAQDETSFNGISVKELRSLAELGITAIDYANNRYEYADATQPNGIGYREIATVNLQAEQEGVKYTPVGAGIKIATPNGAPQIVITQVQSEAAVFDHAAAAQNLETNTIKTVASYAYSTRATGQFDYENRDAVNDMTWRITA